MRFGHFLALVAHDLVEHLALVTQANFSGGQRFLGWHGMLRDGAEGTWETREIREMEIVRLLHRTGY